MTKLRVVGTGLLGVNFLTLLLFWYDKALSQERPMGWRIREQTLLLTALCGGWPAGYIAMRVVHHKLGKRLFREHYAALTEANMSVALILCILFMPAPRKELFQDLRRGIQKSLIGGVLWTRRV